jgi:tRNA nucleotidyltransferase (CCA-adding enzyme)
VGHPVSPPAPAFDGQAVLEALRERPGGAELLALGAGREGMAIVGGAVRDLLLGHTPRELDVVVGGDAAALADELVASLAGDGAESARVTLHERFGTAVLEWPGGRVDIATRRAESYPAGGALPEVRPGSAREDLERRDFTVNAIAVALDGEGRGELLYAEHALEDLAAGRLRVLHERSFVEDPTRLLRLARYRARLGFELEPDTAKLAGEALTAGALDTVSRARVGAELRLALGEGDAAGALRSLEDLGVLAAVDSRLSFDAELAVAALELLAACAVDDEAARADLLLLAVLLLPTLRTADASTDADMRGLLHELEFPAADQRTALEAAVRAAAIAEELAEARTASEVHAAVASASFEGIALAGAIGGEEAHEAAGWWLGHLHTVRLSITGEDLIAAGIPEGPEIGRRLAATLALRLDGELAEGREAELRAALRDEESAR